MAKPSRHLRHVRRKALAFQMQEVLAHFVAAMDLWLTDTADDGDTLDRLDDLAGVARAILAEIPKVAGKSHG